MNAIAQKSMAGIAVSQKDMVNAIRFLFHYGVARSISTLAAVWR